MDKKFLIMMFCAGIVLCSVLFLKSISAVNNNNPEIIRNGQIIVGYCPTMSYVAEEIASGAPDIIDVILIPHGNAADALESLRKGEISAALIGRLAKKTEIQGAKEARLDMNSMASKSSGYTLVGMQKMIVAEHELSRITVHTYIDQSIARSMLPVSELVFHQDPDSALKELRQGSASAALISWDDYADGLELVIPVDSRMRKIESFRVPVIYYFDDDLIERLKA